MDFPVFLQAVRDLAREADDVAGDLRLPTRQHAFSVHHYALPAYEAFLRRHYADAHPRVAGIAMNPGKHGACQTGIPFTDLARGEELVPGLQGLLVRDAMPRLPKPAREQSGRRIYAWGDHRFGSAEAFLRNVIFLIPCPIAVLEEDAGRLNNVPLDLLPRREGAKCLDLIRRHAPALLEAAQPRGVLLLGAYAEGVWQVLQEGGTAPKVPVGRALHPAAHVPDAEIVRSIDAAWRKLERAMP